MSEQFEGRVLRNSEPPYTIKLTQYVTDNRQCPSFEACQGTVNQYYYMPEPNWRNMFVCDYHGSILKDGWIKV